MYCFIVYCFTSNHDNHNNNIIRINNHIHNSLKSLNCFFLENVTNNVFFFPRQTIGMSMRIAGCGSCQTLLFLDVPQMVCHDKFVFPDKTKLIDWFHTHMDQVWSKWSLQWIRALQLRRICNDTIYWFSFCQLKIQMLYGKASASLLPL